jgi:hypothetical protein
MFHYHVVMAVELTAEEVRSFVDRIVTAGCADDPVEQVDVIAALEVLKSAAAAVQAETSVVYDARRRADEAAAGVRAAGVGAPKLPTPASNPLLALRRITAVLDR